MAKGNRLFSIGSIGCLALAGSAVHAQAGEAGTDFSVLPEAANETAATRIV